MNEKFDILIIGAGTSGAYIAKLLAEKGHSVIAFDSKPKDKVGAKYDIMHIEEKEFELLNLPRPREGERAWAFEFSDNYTADPLGLYPKKAVNPIVGVHMFDYTHLLHFWAEKYGARFIFNAKFDSFILENGKIKGAKILGENGEESVFASVVIDCSGMTAAGRTSLPKYYGIDTRALSDDDMFYVILRYVKLKNESDFLKGSCGWPFFKGWIAPCADPEGAIIGIGACHSYDHADKMYAIMEENVPLPEHTVLKIEKGRTPYTVPPFSLVADHFVAGGDAVCLTKPLNGEGVTSSMHQLLIVADVVDSALRVGDTSKKSLWRINTEYNRTLGADFAFLRALLVGVVNAATFDEFEYAFSSGMITDELMSGELNASSTIAAAKSFLAGIIKSKISANTVKAALSALKNALDAKKLYAAFPDDPVDFPEWAHNAGKLWNKVGKIK